MRIVNHRLEGAAFTPAVYTGDKIVPEIVVLHDTAGPLTKGSSAAYLAGKNTAQASVHFVVERDGTITQLVATNRKANHAGKSSWQGRELCNAFSIGIEIVNPGRMMDAGSGYARTWWGEKYRWLDEHANIQSVKTPEHGAGLWMGYAPEQIAAVTELLQVLFRSIQTLTDITTHWYISPGRKVDVNPLFPLDQVRAAVLGHDDPADAAANEASQPASGEMVQIVAPSGLNMRRWPSFNPNVIRTIPDGTVVPVLRRGAFGGRQWLCVLFDDREGWIVARYTRNAPLS